MKMGEFHFTGYRACVDTYYYSSDAPIDVTVYADSYSEALTKAEKLLECNFHSATLKCVVKEVCYNNGKEKMEGSDKNV